MAKNTPIEVSKEAYYYFFPEQWYTEEMTKIAAMLLESIARFKHLQNETNKLLKEVRIQRMEQITPLVDIGALFN